MNYSKEIEALKDIIQGLETKSEELEEKVSVREEYFNDKAEKWQESQAGLTYQEKTESIDYELNELATIISDFEMHLSTLEGL